MTASPQITGEQILAVLLALAGIGIVVLCGFLEFRERQLQAAKNAAAEAERGKAHAEAELHVARETDDDLTRDFRILVDGNDDERKG